VIRVRIICGSCDSKRYFKLTERKANRSRTRVRFTFTLKAGRWASQACPLRPGKCCWLLESDFELGPDGKRLIARRELNSEEVSENHGLTTTFEIAAIAVMLNERRSPAT
jgi:hypothetical protein